MFDARVQGGASEAFDSVELSVDGRGEFEGVGFLALGQERVARLRDRAAARLTKLVEHPRSLRPLGSRAQAVRSQMAGRGRLVPTFLGKILHVLIRRIDASAGRWYNSTIRRRTNDGCDAKAVLRLSSFVFRRP